MVSEGVLGALVGATAAVLGSVVQAYFNRQNVKDRIEAEDNRKRAEFILEKEAEVLFELVESIQAMNSKIQKGRSEFYDQNGELPDAEREMFDELIDDVGNSIQKSQPFVSTRTYSKFNELLDVYIDFISSLVEKDPSQFDNGEYHKVYSQTLLSIQEEMESPLIEFTNED